MKHTCVREADALEPGSEIKNVRVGWISVDGEGSQIKGPLEWPAAGPSQAIRIVIVPSLSSPF